jgi:serine/threonine-protein kinase
VETPPESGVAANGQTPELRASEAGDLAGRLLDGRYQVAKKVGEGGMCVVYLAKDQTNGDRVAVKILLPALMADSTSMHRLRREAALASKLEHPNVCHILRIGESLDGFDYVVMPFLEGDLLCDRIVRAGQLELGLVARFVRDMCAGLGLAHRLGVIHRDLKPENIMVVRAPDGTERAVVMDFSLATARNVPALTTPGLVVGTPEFMSPEQLRGQEIDSRSDVYSLALMVYEMLTGQLPFEGQTQHDIMIARLKGALTPIRRKRPDLPISVSVERVLNRALAQDAAKRYPTVEKFGAAFSRAASGGTWWGRLWSAFDRA